MTGSLVVALALLLAAMGCSDAPKLNEPLDAERVVTPRSPATAAQPQPADAPAAPQPAVSPPVQAAPPVQAVPPVQAGGRGSTDTLAVAAGLDSALLRRIEAWDREIEAGLVRQSRIRGEGRAAMEAEADRLRTFQAAGNQAAGNQAAGNQAEGRASLVDLYLLGRMQGKLDRVDEAQATFKQALERDSDFLFAHEGLALCVGQPDSRELREAMRVHINRAFDIWADFPRGLLVLGQIQMQDRDANGKVDLRRVLETFGRIPRDHPAYEDALIGICNCLVADRQYTAAIVKLRAALEKHPERIEWWVNLALAQMGAGKNADAEGTLQSVLRAEPQHPTALLLLAQLHAERGDLEGAAKLCVEVRDNPANPRSMRKVAIRQLNQLAMGLRQGKARSLQEVLTVLVKDPDPARRREVAGELLAQAGAEMRAGAPRLLLHPVFVQAFRSKLNVNNESDEGVRVIAVRVVAFNFSKDDITLVALLLDPKIEPSKLVRGMAATQLGRLRIEFAPIGQLVLALEDPEPYVFRQARTALRRITEKQFHGEIMGATTAEERALVAAAWQAWYGKRQASRKANAGRPAERR